MLAAEKGHHINLMLSGEVSKVDEFLSFLRSRYAIDVMHPSAEEDDDDELVNVFETDWWKENATPGSLLAGFRLKHELTQKQLAAKIGLCHWTISAYERGKKRITRDYTDLVAHALDEDPDFLYRCVTEQP